MQVLLAKDQHVVQAFPPHTSQEPLTEGVGSWCSVRRSQHLDAACLSNFSEPVAKLAVVVSYQELWCLSKWRLFSKLLSHPHASRRSRDAEVHHSARPKLYDEDVQRPEEQIIHWEEVASPYLLGVVMQERGPVLNGLAL